MSYLIESPDGQERVHTRSLDGYEDWRVLAEGAKAEPVEGAQWDEAARAWTVDPMQSAEARRAAEVRAMPSQQRFDVLMDEIEALKAQMITLEQFIDSGGA